MERNLYIRLTSRMVHLMLLLLLLLLAERRDSELGTAPRGAEMTCPALPALLRSTIVIVAVPNSSPPSPFLLLPLQTYSSDSNKVSKEEGPRGREAKGASKGLLCRPHSFVVFSLAN